MLFGNEQPQQRYGSFQLLTIIMYQMDTSTIKQSNGFPAIEFGYNQLTTAIPTISNIDIVIYIFN